MYKIKENLDNTVRFKARLVIRGLEQQYGVDYGETFAPVLKIATICLLFALAVHFNVNMDSMDVITVFLHPEIDEEVYMELPEGYGIPNIKTLSPQECRQSYVCKLNKAIYGLKQAPRAWYSDVDAFLPSISF